MSLFLQAHRVCDLLPLAGGWSPVGGKPRALVFFEDSLCSLASMLKPVRF